MKMASDAAVELLPCPWAGCGSDRVDALVEELHLVGQAPGIMSFQGHVECHDCGVRGPQTCWWTSSEGNNDGSREKAKTDAARLWNTRLAHTASGAEGWITVRADAAHYVDYGRDPIVCDRLARPVTLLLKNPTLMDHRGFPNSLADRVGTSATTALREDAREMLAAEQEKAGNDVGAQMTRNYEPLRDSPAIRAIEAALTRPAPLVDVEGAIAAELESALCAPTWALALFHVHQAQAIRSPLPSPRGAE